MGLFSSKKKTFVSNSNVRVVQDEQIDDPYQKAILRAIFADEDITAHLVEGMLHSPGLKADQLFKYAEEHYPHGLPDASFVDARGGIEVIQPLLNSLAGREVHIEYAEIGGPDVVHLVREHLFQQYDWDYQTNNVQARSTLRGTPVYLEDIRVEFPINEERVLVHRVWGDGGGTDSFWRTVRESFHVGERINSGQLSGYNQVHYKEDVTHPQAVIMLVWEKEIEVAPPVLDEDGNQMAPALTEIELEREEITLDLSWAYEEGVSLFHVGYSYREGSRIQYGFWTYMQGAGQYPELDTLHDLHFQDGGTYFPFIFFRSERGNLAAEEHHDTEHYRAASKMLDYLGMDYQGLSDSIHENPDIKDVRQAIMTFSVPITSEHPLEQRYLYDFFNDLYQQNASANRGPRNVYSNMVNPTSEGLIIQDADYKVMMTYREIRRKTVGGKIGAVGTYSSGLTNVTGPVTYTTRESLGGGEFMERTHIRMGEIQSRFFRHQVSESFYTEILVLAPEFSYQLTRTRTIYRLLDSDDFLVPLNKQIVDQYSNKIKNELYLRSLHLVVNSVTTVRVKWYETSAFRFVLTVAAVVISAWTGFSDGGQLAAWVTTLGVNATAAVVIAVIVQAVVVNIAFEWVAKQVGAEVAMVLAVVALVAGATDAFQAGGLQQATWAENLITLANGLMTGAESVFQDMIEGVQNEIVALNELQDLRREELDAAQDLLSTQSILDPWEMIRPKPLVFFGEAPGDYFERTVHSGNVGTWGYDAIEHYVDLSLKLPTFHSTMGDTFNA